mmetsp:Transcript_732/g.1484  ORF Transcript_732/g.1484 Transcript_732/m.1484 type:complete len:143 (+) Transcript_732:101-529(+)
MTHVFSGSASIAAVGGNKESINFDNLLLVEKPDSPLNSSFLPQTLEGCTGYLQRLPLKNPNADTKKASTIADMVNILTHSEADATFEKERPEHDGERKEGEPGAVYNYNTNLMMEELKQAKSRESHTKAPGYESPWCIRTCG